MKQKAGCIILSSQEPGKIALIYRVKNKDYSFPKGHVEKDERIEECAVREVKEETGLSVSLIKKLSTIEYLDSKNEKTITTYYLAKSLNDLEAFTEEENKLIWVPIDEVCQVLTYENMKSYFKSISFLLKE